MYNGMVPFTNPNTHAMGAKANHAKKTAEERSEAARELAKKRWAKPKVRKLKKAA